MGIHMSIYRYHISLSESYPDARHPSLVNDEHLKLLKEDGEYIFGEGVKELI
jgi:hypothetical protein